MLDINNLSRNQKDIYGSIIEKRADNPDALNFLKLVANSNECIFLTGKAGTGKSTIIKDIIDFSKKIDNPPLVLGSTGISALNIGGQTVHSFFALGIEHIDYKDIQYYIKDKKDKKNKKYKLKKEKIKILAKVPFVVIDEISMLSSNIIDCVNFMMKYYLTKESGDMSLARKSFGGKQIIFVGDVFQLPPVKTREREQKFSKTYISEWFFDSKTFKKLEYKAIELKKSYRQQDDMYFGTLLDAIRNGSFNDEHIKIFNKQQYNIIDKESVLLSTHRDKVSNINEQKLARISGNESKIEGEIEGIFPDSMKKADEVLRLKIGAKVMMLTNDINGFWVNGSMGIVKNIEEEVLEVDIKGNIVQISKAIWENKNIEISKTGEIKEEILGTYTQFPVKLAYAITVHKSQGLTFDSCYLDLSDTFTGGQIYTALSRSRTLAGIKLVGEIKKEHIIFHEEIKRFVTEQLSGKLSETKNNEKEKIEYTEDEIEVTIENKKVKESIMLTEEDQIVFEELRKVRLDLARKENMPPYIIFADSVLKDIVRYKPQNKEEMINIKGIRERKFNKYGQIFIDKIKEVTFGNTKKNDYENDYEDIESKIKKNIENSSMVKYIKEMQKSGKNKGEVEVEKKEETPKIKENYMQKQKEKYANAYKSRTENEDDKLRKLFNKGLDNKTLAIVFERNTGGIIARLKKLGLTQG